MEMLTKYNTEPIRLVVNLDHERWDENLERYVFQGKVAVKIFNKKGDDSYTITESFPVFACKDVFGKYLSVKDKCDSDYWGYGVEVLALLDLYEEYFKHNCYTIGYYFEMIDLEPKTSDAYDDDDTISI